uniref:hypothetical protein n=1 Tax=Lunatimonas salinarum TaxID=1774590 RepID=UPI001FD73C04
RGLQSRFLQCMPHGKPPCDLLTLRGVTPARKGLAPSGILWYLRYQMPMPGTHSTYPKVAVQWLNEALCIYQSLCLVESEVLRNRHLRVAAKRYATDQGAPFEKRTV